MFERYAVQLASTIFSGDHYELSGNSLQQYFSSIRIILMIRKTILLGDQKKSKKQDEDESRIDTHVINIDTKDIGMMVSDGFQPM
ncbi:MAG: hypothetical protein ABC596_08780 [Candidatus Methanosuratincola petrocarbonis]